MAKTWSGDDGRGGRWRRWTTTAVDDDNGDGGQRQWQWRTTTMATVVDTAVDDNGTQDWAVDYEGGGGERAANNNGIRARQAESMKN